MKYKKISIITFVTLFAVLVNVATAKISVQPGKTYQIVEVKDAVDGSMTEFIFNDDNGEKHSILELTKGKYAFLNFWGTWCPPCRKEIPDIIQLQEELKKDIVVFGIALERKEDEAVAVVNEFAKKQNINYVNFVGGKDVISKLINSYNGVAAVPTTFLVDKSNKIADKIVGAESKEAFKSRINKMMK